MPRLFLLDGHALAFRAFFAMEASLSTKDGRPTNAVYGCAAMLNKIFEQHRPDYVVAAFDRGEPTIRLERYPDYKGQRDRMPEELKLQMDSIKELFVAHGIKIFEVDGHEADDVLGTICLHAEAAGLDSVIVTSDRDSLQLVSPRTKVMLTRKGVSEVELMGEAEVRAKYGLEPRQLIDLKALMGDASDNIKGVKGIGEKTATALIGEFSSVEGVYLNLDSITRPRLRDLLVAGQEDAFLSKFLATIVTDVSLDLDFSRLEPRVEDTPRLARLFRDLELHSFLKRLEQRGIPVEETIKPPVVAPTPISTASEADLGVALVVGARGDIVVVREGAVRSFSLQDMAVVAELEQILKQLNLRKIVYDYKQMERLLHSANLSLGDNVFDLELAAYLLDPGQPDYSWREIVTKTLGVEATDGQSASDFALPLAQKLMAELANKALQSLYYDVELPLAKVLLAMENTGVHVDHQILQEMNKGAAARLDDLMAEIHGLAGGPFNIASPKQLGAVLFEKLGLPSGKKTKTGFSTDVEVLEVLADQHPIIGKILEYRTLAKLKSTYLEGLQWALDPQGIVHTTYKQTVAATGRLSSTEPNLQNIPIRLAEGRMIRRAFVPAPEYTHILAADYSQIELRILAHLSRDPIMTASYQAGEDIHRRTAAEVFGVNLSDVTREMRDRAKAVNFGIVYGISDYGLSRDIKVPRAVARDYIDNYFARYAGVKRYIDETVAQAKADGYVTTLLNRRRYLPDINSSNATRRAFAERTAMNTPIQGAAADLIKLAMVRIHEALQRANMKSRMILQVHDELIFETTTAELKPLAQLVKHIMESALVLTVPLVVDTKVGTNWYNVEPYVINGGGHIHA